MLIAFCDGMQKRGNVYFAERFVILMRVALSHHEMSEMSEYDTADFVEAVSVMKGAIDRLG